MSRFSTLLLASALATLSFVPNGWAENSPVVRDCALGAPPPPAVDPDFVLLSGATLSTSNGAPTVLPSQESLVLTASESVDSGDQAATVTLAASVKSPGTPTQSFFGTRTGFVMLRIPLSRAKVGQVYTISWSATFDNGQHACPSTLTQSNTTPIPFVVTVVGK